MCENRLPVKTGLTRACSEASESAFAVIPLQRRALADAWRSASVGTSDADLQAS